MTLKSNDEFLDRPKIGIVLCQIPPFPTEQVLYLPVGHRKIGDFVIVLCNALGLGKSRLTLLPYDLKYIKGECREISKLSFLYPIGHFFNLLDKYYTSIFKTYHFDKDIGIVALEPADDNF